MARIPLPSESEVYRRLRAELLEAEIDLKDRIERVAALRRRLPRDTPFPDLVLHEGPQDLRAGDEPIREVRLSELFDVPDQPLILVHFMFGGRQTEPCPMCTLWADGYHGVVPALRRRANFAVAVAGDLGTMRPYARRRGWTHLRIVSTAGTSLKRDLGMESPDGAQEPGVSIFLRDGVGGIRHFYTGGAILAEGQYRGMDLLCPVWHFFDLTPEGRGDFWPDREL